MLTRMHLSKIGMVIMMLVEMFNRNIGHRVHICIFIGAIPFLLQTFR